MIGQVKKILLSAISVIVVTLSGCSDETSPKQPVQVAILQFVEHPALNMEREAIKEKLKAAGYIEGENLTLHIRVGDGKLTNMYQMAREIVSQRPNVVVAIATPAAQAMLSMSKQHSIPMVFTAVTDPKDAKLLEDPDHPSADTTVTGVSDAMKMGRVVAFTKKIIPHVRRIGVIYNPGEMNSVIQVRELRESAQREGLEMIEAPATGTAEVPQAVTSLLDKPDLAIVVPTDNTAVSAMKSIVNEAMKKNVPVIASDTGSLHNGVLGVAALDRTELGTMAGELVIDILKGKKPSELPVRRLASLKDIANPAVAQKLGIQIPEGIERMETKEGEP